MSAPTAEPARGPTGGLLVVVALGLMALAGIAAFLLVGTAKSIDGQSKLVEAFGSADVPFGLAVEASTRTPTGASLVVLARPGAAPEPAPVPVHDGEPAKDAPRVDWAAVPVPDAREAPRQVAFLFVPQGMGRATIDEMVRNVRGGDRGELSNEGGLVVVDRGKLAFRGYDAEWVHLRTYERGPTFRDAMRVSLSTPETPCVLTLTWPRGSAASRDVLLDVVRPLGATSG